ncbi:hypothetical protein BY458DRAFT_232607 [Sporodiniella umbellata]|nr:hypothetical protein BY458DRAFT_232607 [Sporodiniella umbellata]
MLKQGTILSFHVGAISLCTFYVTIKCQLLRVKSIVCNAILVYCIVICALIGG